MVVNHGIGQYFCETGDKIYLCAGAVTMAVSDLKSIHINDDGVAALRLMMRWVKAIKTLH